jgi:hypothetical protein
MMAHINNSTGRTVMMNFVVGYGRKKGGIASKRYRLDIDGRLRRINIVKIGNDGEAGRDG